jgi:5-methylcytosine-specific restriction enzyme A
VPTVDQLKRAFLAIQDKITPNQLNMLKAHYAAAGRSATMTQLARAGVYESYAVANLQYGKLGHMLSDALDGLISERKDGAPNWTFVLGEVTRTSGDGKWVWVMRPEVAKALEQLGWLDGTGTLVKASPAQSHAGVAAFEVGRVYHRRDDIHTRFGGQRQGGISTPSGVPYIFLFTGESGEQYGYKDDWNEDGVYLYTGEGQVGDMQFVRGNRAIRDHLADGKDLLMFKNLGRGKGVRFLGSFACASWETRTGPDLNGHDREVIVFHLIRQEESEVDLSSAPARSGLSLEELHRRALQSSSTPSERDTKHTRRRYYERSEDVRAYVLARANGTCESCGKPAPFMRPDGSPYLEPHHTRRVSDGGPDHPRWVGGICPTCHKEIHYGVNGNNLNRKLQERLSQIERS